MRAGNSRDSLRTRSVRPSVCRCVRQAATSYSEGTGLPVHLSGGSLLRTALLGDHDTAVEQAAVTPPSSVRPAEYLLFTRALELVGGRLTPGLRALPPREAPRRTLRRRLHPINALRLLREAHFHLGCLLRGNICETHPQGHPQQSKPTGSLPPSLSPLSVPTPWVGGTFFRAVSSNRATLRPPPLTIP